MAKAAGFVCALLLLASFCCPSLAQRGSAVPDTCCFQFQKTKIRKANAVGYYLTSPVCPHPAVIFKTRNGREICAKPDTPWVTEYQKSLNSTRKA